MTSRYDAFDALKRISSYFPKPYFDILEYRIKYNYVFYLNKVTDFFLINVFNLHNT